MTRFTISTLLVALTLSSTACSNLVTSDQSQSEVLTLHTRERDQKPEGQISVVEKTSEWESSKTAIIICDMWDDHWCKGAAARVGELAVPMNQMVSTARSKGVLIIHAPSSVVGFYQGTPQRERAINAVFSESPSPLSKAERWGTSWCWPDPKIEPNMPIEDSDMGCDCKVKCKIREAWTRQNELIQIHKDDVITDNGQETVNVLEERGIDNVILVGVHLNMCVLGRPFGIRQMVKVGKNVVLMRDMTDTMYNHEMRPFVSHFDGTDLVVNHIEQYWCPSIVSTDVTGKPPFRFKEDNRKP